RRVPQGGRMKRLTSITFSVAAMLVGLSADVVGQLPQPTPQIAEQATGIDRYPTHQVSFANGVRGLPDVVYWNRLGYRPLTLDLYLPPASLKQPETGFPLVVQIHGGGWLRGDKRFTAPFVDWPGVLASLASKGYVVASINYRLSSEATFPAQAQDVKSAIRWLRVNAATYSIDPARVAAWGASAGGHLPALARRVCAPTPLEPQ